jgi:hypothetical protein
MGIADELMLNKVEKINQKLAVETENIFRLNNLLGFECYGVPGVQSRHLWPIYNR